MKVLIVGAGSVGRSIAKELTRRNHEVTLLDKSSTAMRIASVPQAEWILADGCEPQAIENAEAGKVDVVVSATGDDKANLVVSLLSKTEFGVPRTVARVNEPKNEWLFDDAWGVDVAVSTPRIMTALVEEAVSEGDLVRIFTFQKSGASMYEITLPKENHIVGKNIQEIQLPTDVVISAILRQDQTIVPSHEVVFEPGDQLLLVISEKRLDQLEELQLYFTPPISQA